MTYSSDAKEFGVARIRIFSQKSKNRVYPKLTVGNFGKLLRFLAVLAEQKIVSVRTKSRATYCTIFSIIIVAL